MFAPQNKKNCPQKLLIIPRDQKFPVQHFFPLCNWGSFLVWLFLIFEVIKLCRMKIESPDEIPHSNLFTFGKNVTIYKLHNQIHKYCRLSVLKVTLMNRKTNNFSYQAGFLHLLCLFIFVHYFRNNSTTKAIIFSLISFFYMILLLSSR